MSLGMLTEEYDVYYRWAVGALVMVFIILAFGVVGTLDYDSQPSVLIMRGSATEKAQRFESDCQRDTGMAVTLLVNKDLLQIKCLGYRHLPVKPPTHD